MDEKQALKLLKKYSTDDRSYRAVRKHTLAVLRYATWIADRAKKNHEIDVEFVRTATILHDIGRFKCPPWGKSIKHGVEGAKILRKEKLPEKYARVCENHLGAGLTKADIKKQNLPIPVKDYIPKTKEDKIISYADMRIKEDKIKPISYSIRRFAKYGKTVEKRVIKLHNEIQKLYKPKRKVKIKS